MKKYYPYVLLTLFSLILYLPGIANIPVIDRDEAHFSQATRQMLQTNEYFQIRFQDRTRYQKPPGINWLQAASVKLFSNADSNKIWPYRIPSALGAFLSVLLTFMLGKRLMPDSMALLGAGFLACALLVLIESHMAVIDTSLLSSVILMQGALWVIYSGYQNNHKTHWLWSLTFWLAMTYGFVLKGVTPLVGGLTVLTLCVIEKNVSWLKKLHIFWGLALLVVLSLIWLLQVNAAEQSNYLLQMIQKDLLPKLQGGHESHGQPPLFHLAILPLTLWPASLFLWPGVVFAFRKRHLTWVKFLLAWIIPTWIFFEVMPTKLPQYVLPTFPAICLLMAASLQDEKKRVFKEGKLLAGLQVLWGLLTFGLAVCFLLLPWLVIQKFILVGILIFLILVILGLFAAYFALKHQYKKACFSIFLLAFFAYPLIFSQLLPQLKPLWATQQIADAYHKESAKGDRLPLLAVGYHEPSLVMTLNTHEVKYANLDEVLLSVKKHPRQMILIDEQHWLVLPQKSEYHILWQEHGFNYSKGKWLHLLLIQKNE